MPNLIQKIEVGTEHMIAAEWQDAIKIGHFIEGTVKPILQKAEAESSTIEQVSALVSPKAAAIESALFSSNGLVTKSLSAIASADALAADQAAGKPILVDITSLVSTLKSLL